MFQKPMRNDILIKRWQESNFSTKLNVEWRIAWNLTPDAWSFWEQEDQSKIKQIILCLLSVHSNCWWLLLTEYSFKSPKLFRVFVQSFSLFSGQTKRKLFILTPGYLLLTHIYILWQHSFTTRPTLCLIIALHTYPPFLASLISPSYRNCCWNCNMLFDFVPRCQRNWRWPNIANSI